MDNIGLMGFCSLQLAKNLFAVVEKVPNPAYTAAMLQALKQDGWTMTPLTPSGVEARGAVGLSATNLHRGSPGQKSPDFGIPYFPSTCPARTVDLHVAIYTPDRGLPPPSRSSRRHPQWQRPCASAHGPFCKAQPEPAASDALDPPALAAPSRSSPHRVCAWTVAAASPRASISCSSSRPL